MYYTKMKTQFCDIILVGDERGLTRLHLDTGEGSAQFTPGDDLIYNNDIFGDVICEINAYMRGDLVNFTVKLAPQGTDYRKSVWRELRNIEFGNTVSYKNIAAKMGTPKNSRAVGGANGKNPIPLIVPCHRVIGTSGALTGFAHGVDVKEKLIDFERLVIAYHKLEDHYGTRGSTSFKDDDITNHFFSRLGIHNPKSCSDLFIPNSDIFSNYYPLISEHVKNVCISSPKCDVCPLSLYCKKKGV